jgi:hypothetical protein
LVSLWIYPEVDGDLDEFMAASLAARVDEGKDEAAA